MKLIAGVRAFPEKVPLVPAPSTHRRAKPSKKVEEVIVDPPDPNVKRTRLDILAERVAKTQAHKREITRVEVIPTPQEEQPVRGTGRRGRPKGAQNSYPRGLRGVVPEGFVTMLMVCDRFSIEVREFKAMQKMGLFRPTRRMGTIHLYDVEVFDIVRLRKMRHKTARAEMMSPTDDLEKAPYLVQEGLAVMRGLADGKNLAQIFLETEIHPVAIRSIVADHEHLTDSLFIPKEFLDKLKTLPIDAIFPIRSPKQLFDLIETMALALEKKNVCSECKTNDCAICMVCFEDAVEAAGQLPEEVTDASHPESDSSGGTTNGSSNV